jgi:hypothetical protein
MVSGARRLELLLARVLRWGAWVGVACALGGVLTLGAMGEPLRPWPMAFSDFGAGDRPWLARLATSGLWLLALTPSLMLLGLAAASARARAWRLVAVSLGILAIAGVGLGLALG